MRVLLDGVPVQAGGVGVMLLGDHPISNPSLDLLNRTGFAAYLAKAIDDLSPTNSGFVLALIGEWGSGKSSAIAFVLRWLENREILNVLKSQDSKYDGWGNSDVERLRASYAKVEPMVRDFEDKSLDTSFGGMPIEMLHSELPAGRNNHLRTRSCFIVRGA